MRIGQKGFTLVEIIVSLAIMTIVAGSVGAFIVAGNNSYLRGSKELTLQEEAQLTANQMIDLIIDVEKDIKVASIAKVRQEVNKSESAEETAEQIEEELKNEVRYSDEDDVSEEDLIRDELGEDDTEE